MTRAKSTLNKILLLFLIALIGGLIGYFLPHKPSVITKEVPALYGVIEVIDGDTIKVDYGGQIESVRLIGIDTPEIPSPYNSKGSCFGKEATQYAEQLLEKQSVYLIKDPMGSNRDKYNRLLRYIFLEDGTLINAKLIKEGYAFNYIYEPFQFMKQFDYLEKEAKENRIGLWSDECDYYFEVEVEKGQLNDKVKNQCSLFREFLIQAEGIKDACYKYSGYRYHEYTPAQIYKKECASSVYLTETIRATVAEPELLQAKESLLGVADLLDEYANLILFSSHKDFLEKGDSIGTQLLNSITKTREKILVVESR